MENSNSADLVLLSQLNKVGDIKKLSQSQFSALTLELRQFLITSTQKTGGHLSSNLGVVELSIALHFVLDLPKDEIIWDVSHQSYVHKILTGRKEKMATLRQAGGISGFTKIKESPFDPFGAGHACTSISAALGIALAKKMQNDDGLVVAVIGDGAMTGGMAYEALNNSSIHQDLNVLIILNDNKMSISQNIGGITETLSKLANSSRYREIRSKSKNLLKKTSPELLKFVKKSEDHLKEILAGSSLFEQLGVRYSGPIDGHNTSKLINRIEELKKSKGVRLLHIQTQKGKGIIEAEQNPLKYHGVKPQVNPSAKNQKKSANLNEISTTPRISYSAVFGKWLTCAAKKYPNLIGVTPAMSQGSMMEKFAKKYPNRFFDVGIAEQHAMTFCAGFAAKGEKPVLAIYSTFLQRAFDQLIHDVSLQDLDVTLAIDRAGIVGQDGPTHSGQFDLSFLRILPKIVLMTPSDEIEMIQMLKTAYEYKGLSAVRYPKGHSNETINLENIKEAIKNNLGLEIGRANIIRRGSKFKKIAKKDQQSLAILVFGDLLFEAKKVANDLDATLIDMRFIKPLDEKLLLKLAKNHTHFATIEENAIQGGAGSSVAEFFNSQNINVAIKHFGIRDAYIDQGERKEILKNIGLFSESIKNKLYYWMIKN